MLFGLPVLAPNLVFVKWSRSPTSTFWTYTNDDSTVERNGAGSSQWRTRKADKSASVGNSYVEFTITGDATDRMVGLIRDVGQNYETYLGADANSVGWSSAGDIYNSGGVVNTTVGWTTGDILGVALERPTNRIAFYKNGARVGQETWALAVPMFPGCSASPATAGRATSIRGGVKSLQYLPSGYTPWDNAT